MKNVLNKDMLRDVLKRTLNQSPHPDLFLKEVDAALHFKEVNSSSEVFLDELVKHIDDTRLGQNDELRILFHSWLSDFDGRERNDRESWLGNTLPCTQDRRSVIYSLIKLSDANIQIIEKCFPVPRDASRGFKSGKDLEWYDDERKDSTRHYASAIDVGYRLIIVLAGMTDLLREQTQRRFDKEVAGRKVLLQDPEVHDTENGYIDAKDWEAFIEHSKPRLGLIPKDIERLTTRSNDYRKPLGNAFPRAWISSTSCRVVIIKKNESRLKSLINALERGITTPDRKELSVLVLDDESDQATVNIVNPEKTKIRKGINGFFCT